MNVNGSGFPAKSNPQAVSSSFSRDSACVRSELGPPSDYILRCQFHRLSPAADTTLHQVDFHSADLQLAAALAGPAKDNFDSGQQFGGFDKAW